MKRLTLLPLAACLALLLSQCETPSGMAGGGNVPPASKDSPFVNSLGMKFVPVPGTNVLFCTTETTVAQYQAAGLGYQAPQFAQGSSHPAVNVTWKEAEEWCAWLSKQERRKYRLPTYDEWSAAVGTSARLDEQGTAPSLLVDNTIEPGRAVECPWGYSWPPPNNVGNYAGQEMRGCTPAERALLFPGFGVIRGFRDQHRFTAPVGSYPANHLGIHDLGGNVWEWCEDWHPNARGLYRVLRGGSWYESLRKDLDSGSYNRDAPLYQMLNTYGFRCVVVR